jgi:hypothetical protein
MLSEVKGGECATCIVRDRTTEASAVKASEDRAEVAPICVLGSGKRQRAVGNCM